MEWEFNFYRDRSVSSDWENWLYFDPGGLLLSDLIFLVGLEQSLSLQSLAGAHVTSRAAARTQNTTSKWISTSTHVSRGSSENCVQTRRRRETTDGTRAAHQRRLNPDLFLALRLPVNHCCSFQRGEWIWSAPGTHRLILNCLADNFYIIAGC